MAVAVESVRTNFGETIREINSRLRMIGKLAADLRERMDDAGVATDSVAGALRAIAGENEEQVSSVDSTASAVEEIARNIDNLNQTVQDQVANVNESSAAVEEMVSNIQSIGQNVNEVGRNFSSLTSSTDSGRTKLALVTDRAEAVSRQSDTLLETSLVISKIAAQTNLLSMNAAIEAAHAGQYGRGFAVVADEIRKLAEMSGAQSKEITASLKSMKESIEGISPAARDASDTFSLVQTEVHRLSGLVDQVQQALAEQTAGSREISEALSRMNDITVTVRDGSREMHSGSDLIVSEVAKLRDISSAVSSQIGATTRSSDQISSSISRVREAMGDVAEALDYALRAFSVDES